MAGADCYGGIKIVFKDNYGFDPFPSFNGKYEDTRDWKGIQGCIESQRQKWKEIDQPREGAIIIFNIKGRPHHVGICTGIQSGEPWFFHIPEGGTAKHERLESSRWNNRIESMYIWDK